MTDDHTRQCDHCELSEDDCTLITHICEGIAEPLGISWREAIKTLRPAIEGVFKEREGDDVHSVEEAMKDANGGWQPIETAPKDVMFVWVYDPNSEWQCEAWWDDRFNGWQCPHEGVAPSHWRPLPAAPTEGE